MAAPVVSGLIAFVALRPDRSHDDTQHKGGTWHFLILLILVLALWLGIGRWLFAHPGEPPGSTGHALAMQTTPPATTAHH